MANNPARYGFKWHSALLGISQPKPQRMRLASALAIVANPGSVPVDLQVGDPVKYVSDGSVTQCVAADAIYGIVMGFSFQSSNANSPNYLPYLDRMPSGTTFVGVDNQIFVHVQPVAGMIFEAYCNDNTTATAESGAGSYNTFINENVEYIFAPDATTKSARPLLNISTHAVTATLSWRILDVSRRIDVDYSGTFVPLLVSCNKVQQTPFVLTGV
jgi:hypothetical protein